MVICGYLDNIFAVLSQLLIIILDFNLSSKFEHEDNAIKLEASDQFNLAFSSLLYLSNINYFNVTFTPIVNVLTLG